MDALIGMRQLPSDSVQCCVTSPPYWQQRDYGVQGQMGSEATPEDYVEKLVELFKEVYRVLKLDGVLWLNLGDSFWASERARNNSNFKQSRKSPNSKLTGSTDSVSSKHVYLKPKDLVGVPWMVAFALQKEGWYLRQDIIWCKPNGMPESVTDRCTRTHEYIFMFSKSARYYYNADAIKKEMLPSSLERRDRGVSDHHKYAKGTPGQPGNHGLNRAREHKQDGGGRRYAGFNKRYKKRAAALPLQKVNRRSVWVISTAKLRDKHYAAFPLVIPELCIKAGSRLDDVILDPFMGAGTTALAAALLQRKYIGFELNAEYATMARRRLKRVLGLFYPSND